MKLLPPSRKSPAKPARRKPAARNLAIIAVISFSLTFVGVSLALLLGLLPNSIVALDLPVDMGVVLLIVPLCALVLAMMAEALRAAVTGVPRSGSPRTATSLSEWRPGHGEG
ncbi:MAG TPA: hypothetical protein GYA10_16990 [Alphaproteobacteria bacterium]|nr:hypothetical protein [Alphaproteobacteria bacterium]